MGQDRVKATMVPCQTEGCETPLFAIANGVLTIQSRHHGGRHVSSFRIEDLLEGRLVLPDGRLIVVDKPD